MKTVLAAAVLVASLAIGRPAAAQRVTGAIEGTASSDAAAAIAGVTVTILNTDTGLRRSTMTDAGGRYVFDGLPVEGEYEIQAELAGFLNETRTKVRVSPNEKLLIDFKLRLSLAESVIVVASTPPIDVGESSVRQTVNEELVRTLPLIGRNFIHLTSLAAGFTGNPSFPSPQGQIYWANNVLVDGASHFSKWRSAARTFHAGYGLESIKEVQVLANRFSAEFGESLATVTSAVTKAGTNELRGAALLFVQDDAFNAVPVFASSKPAYNSQQFGFTLGGPVVKDRTHFFGSYEGRRSRNHNIVVSPAAAGSFVPDNEDEHLAFFRVDHQVNPENLFAARYNGQLFRWHNEPGGLSLPGTGTDYTNDVHTVLLTAASTLTSTVLNEARVQFARYIDTRFDLQPGVYVSRAGYSLEGGTLGALGFGADPEDTVEAADTISYRRGLQTIRVGAGIKHVADHNAFVNYGRGAYYFAGPPEVAPAPFLFIQGLSPTENAAVANPRSLSAFGFVQDDWTIRPDVTLNLGLRYDVEQITNVRDYSASTDTNNVQPRLGAAWQPGVSGRMLVRGGAGLYTQQQLLFFINRVQLEGPDGTITMSLAPESPLFPVYPNVLRAFPAGAILPPRDIYVLDQAFSNPYSLQATGGMERTLFGNLVIAADYVYLNGRGLMSLVDSNAPASHLSPFPRTVDAADATRPLQPAPNGYRKIITLGNLGESWYHALQIKANRTTGRLRTIVSYTLSRAEDMANYQLPEDSRNLEAERARAATDVRHNLVVALNWDVPGAGRLSGGWSISGIGTFRSSRPYTITWGDDRNGTTQNDARPEDRNTRDTDGYSNVDLSLVRRFRRGTKIIEARIEGFNVFNTTNYDEYIGALSSPLFGRPVSAFQKQRLQLAAVVRF